MNPPLPSRTTSEARGPRGRIPALLSRRWLAGALLTAVIATPSGCLTTEATPPEVAGLRSSRVSTGHTIASRDGIVVCTERNAARIGARVLAEGGTAVDAAVAVAFALAVTHPQAGNIGGGGFMIIRLPDGTAEAIDYREAAPAAFHPEIYLAPDGTLDRKKYENPYVQVGVPGTVAGLELAHKRHGVRPFHLLVRPAARLAREGFMVSPLLARDLKRHQAKLARHPSTVKAFFHWNGVPYEAGEILKQPELASVLNSIATEGPRVFYNGWIGDSLARKVRAGGGYLAIGDFRTYQAKVRTPIQTPLAGGTLIGMPPPSSGGIAVAQIMALLEDMDLRKADPVGPVAAHAMAEAMRRAFRDRALWLGDPDFVQVPVDRLLSIEHLKELRDGIDPRKATKSETLWFEPLPEKKSGETTHFSIIDRNGMAVANTYTLEQSFGGGVVAPDLGIVLNNELGDFNPRPGDTDREGRIGTRPNIPGAGKRPLSSMSPTIFVRDDRVEIITGSPGGRTIINTVVQILFKRIFLEQGPEHCVWGPRLHHQWFPDRLWLEPGMWPPETVKALEKLGHEVVEEGPQGAAHTIFLRERPDGYVGVGDFRRDGWAAAPVWVEE